MKIITITGFKGGVGKSTSAIHLASFLSGMAKVLVVDGDQNRTCINWAKRGSLPFAIVDQRQAVKMVAGHEYVLIDTPARPDTDDLKELAKGCDLLLLPTTPDVVSLEPLVELTKNIRGTLYRVFLTIVPPAPHREADTIKQDLQNSGIPFFQTTIRRTVAYAKAALAGLTVKDVDDYKQRVFWADYENLGQEIVEILK
jgi:chromosome partitioning protein